MNMLTRIIIGAVAGGALGLGWYKVVGCPGGGCPLTSNPWISMAWGMAIGVLAASSFR